MKDSDAFDICHEIYCSARELVDARLPTMQLASASKFLWRPNVRPRLLEYVADFALAGERALTPAAARSQRPCGCSPVRLPKPNPAENCTDESELRRSVQQHASAARERGAACSTCSRRCTNPLRASRLILFQTYYLGGAEYQAARRMLGIGELTWSAWTDEIRARVGRELLRSEIFPPSRYFRQPSRND